MGALSGRVLLAGLPFGRTHRKGARANLDPPHRLGRHARTTRDAELIAATPWSTQPSTSIGATLTDRTVSLTDLSVVLLFAVGRDVDIYVGVAICVTVRAGVTIFVTVRIHVAIHVSIGLSIPQVEGSEELARGEKGRDQRQR